MAFVNTYTGRQQTFSRDSNPVSDFVLCYGQDTKGRFNFQCPRIPGCCGNSCCGSGDAIIRANDDGSNFNTNNNNVEQLINDFVQCTKIGPENTVINFLCQQEYGCCENDCCPKDLNWMPGLYVLIAFVVILMIIGTIAVLVCMSRSKFGKNRNGGYQESIAAPYPTSGSVVNGPIGYGPPAGPGSFTSQQAGSTGYLVSPITGRKYY